MDKELSPRVSRLLARVHATEPELFAERAQILTESYRHNAGKPYILRRALALREILARTEISIGDDELLVGAATSAPRGAQVFPEYDMGFVIRELDSIPLRKADSFRISEETKAQLRNLYPEWVDNSLTDSALLLFNEEQKSSLGGLVFALTALRSGVGHMIVDYPKLLRLGLNGILKEIGDRLSALRLDDPELGEKKLYYTCAQICAQAAVDFAHRYAQLAAQKAEAERDEARRQELLQISSDCMHVPAEPAQNFRQALQSFWFVHLILQIESNGHSVSAGRFDQYMYPFFARDLEQGVPEKELEELLHLLWIKFFEINKVRDKVSSVAFGGYPMFQNLIVGGQDRRGESAVNRLSHLCLEATARLRLPQPSLSARWFFGCENSFLEHCLDVISLGGGMPALFNDEVLIPNMLHMGYTLEEARDYAIVGCTETTGQGNAEPWLTGGFLNVLKVLELTIFNGYDPIKGEQHRLQTGEVERMESFDEFLTAYRTMLNEYLQQLIACNNILDDLHGRLCPTPFESLLLEGCLEHAKTSLEGGAKYNSTTLEIVGLPNAADSLAAIWIAVYRDKLVSWKRLKEALLSGFENDRPLQTMLRERMPKYGNDDELVDTIARELLDHLYEESLRYRSPRGGKYRIALYSIASHVMFAAATGASADGRSAYEVLADGGVSCSQGRDKKGVTALLNTVLKMDPYKALGSTLLNVRLSPALLTPDSKPAVMELIRTYFLRKGQHVQFNVFSAEQLRDAQLHPENYPTLLVRVAGFSVLFTSIDRKLQDDIIMRTEQSSGGWI